MPNPKKPSKLTKKFENFAEKVNDIVGSPYWFVFSVLLIIIWFPTGFFLGWGEIWHLMINSTTTILTFLMMSLLHSSQSKWEQRMEKMQQRESTELKSIGKTAKQIAYTSGAQSENPEKEAISETKSEEVDSLL